VNDVTYEVLEADSIQQLEKLVQTRLAMGAILEGGVATTAVSHRVAKINGDGLPVGSQILQTFYQAVTYDTPTNKPKTLGDLSKTAQDAVNQQVKERIEQEYAKFYNPQTRMFHIDTGTPNEWVCSHAELENDVRRSILEEMSEETQ
jgi:hypothetical protein